MTYKIKTIDINAKEYFDKINGNSYFAAIVTINYKMKNEKTIKLQYQYGYGEHYKDITKQELIKQGYIKTNNEYISLWKYCNENNIILRNFKQTKCLKREVKNFIN